MILIFNLNLFFVRSFIFKLKYPFLSDAVPIFCDSMKILTSLKGDWVFESIICPITSNSKLNRLHFKSSNIIIFL